MVSAHSRLQVSPRMRRDTSQLLLIVSDGRGIFLEGMEVSNTFDSSLYVKLRNLGLDSVYAGLARARSARSGAPWVRNCGYLGIQEILVLTKSSVRTYFHPCM